MSTFAKAGFKSVNYNSFRPHYPPSFYNLLMEYVGRPEVENTIDLGCGSGQALYPLLQYSKHVVGLDLSPPMIETANSLKLKKLQEIGISDESRIAFQVCAVEDFEAPPASFDLITAAECIHWFKDYPKFFEAAARQLRPNGVLAYWFYVDPNIVSFVGPSDSTKKTSEIIANATEIYNRFVYDEPQYLGKHWEQPGRSIIRNLLQEVDSEIPQNLFTDVVIKKYQPTLDGKLSPAADDLSLVRKNITIVDFVNYISTYSLYHNYCEATQKGPELLELIISTFEKELGWDREKTMLETHWTSGYTFMKKL